MTEEFLRSLKNVNLITEKGRINPNSDKILSKYPKLKERLVHFTSFAPEHVTMNIRLACIRDGINQWPTCKLSTCDTPVTFNKDKKRFNDYCSKRCVSMDEVVRRRRSETMVSKYGVTHAMKHDMFVNKTKLSKQQRSDQERILSNNKRIKTINERYGSLENFYKEGRQRAVETNLKNYGVESVSQSEKIKNKISKNHAKRIHNKELLDPINLKKLNSRISSKEISEQYNVSASFISSQFKKLNIEPKTYFTSAPQRSLIKWLREQNIEVEENKKIPNTNLQIDAFLPAYNIGIEMNGVYWHSEISGRKGRMYHLNKTNKCKEVGISLIHIFDNEWNFKQDTIKRRLNHLFHLPVKVYGRNTTVTQISKHKLKKFLQEHHSQGIANSSVNYGLVHKDKILAVMTFSKTRFSKKFEYELVRYCTDSNFHVIGGARKIFNKFIKEVNPSSIVSYKDKRWGVATSLYPSLEFTMEHESSPNYFYFHKSKTTELLSRHQFQKHKLSSKLLTFDHNLSEWENMKNNGYDRIWDCGNEVWSWRKS